ncbi:phosphatase PAP2 family protein [Geodermatophilus ruber]|uniref:Undecaprenyl-diphosphatase n=1 Tax=Geodermatophilus ruber TaxID=504800 RepID=A0A1I4BGU7_9ACTN|nr:phosphatase PAP2 family protein [Geodermatophilus ruber]SFK68008.1 undecaprenyl-diphosphatase [Geodermatophilus ruber]
MATDQVQTRIPPAEERLAGRLAAQPARRPVTTRKTAIAALTELGQIDRAVYRAVAGTPTPVLDRPVRRLSQAANWSRLWIGIAAAMAAVGGRDSRRAAGAGLVALAVDSAVVNGGFKLAARRRRPDRDSAHVPAGRQVPMPHSASFPSGHTASGFAFADAVGQTLPTAAAPLRLLAGAVGYSRVHTGVHYPGDVVLGALIGSSVGELVGWALRRAGRPGTEGR